MTIYYSHVEPWKETPHWLYYVPTPRFHQPLHMSAWCRTCNTPGQCMSLRCRICRYKILSFFTHSAVILYLYMIVLSVNYFSSPFVVTAISFLYTYYSTHAQAKYTVVCLLGMPLQPLVILDFLQQSWSIITHS